MNAQGASGPQEVVREFTICNESGIHARPAAQIVEAANRFESEVFLRKEEDSFEATAKSILSVLSIEGQPGSIIKVRTIGADAEDAMVAMAGLFEGGFREEVQNGCDSE
jgi:phosphocarrier protein HPr